MAIGKLVGLSSAALLIISGCQSWQYRGIGSLPAPTTLPEMLESGLTSGGGPKSTAPDTSQPKPTTAGTVKLSWSAPGIRMDGASISPSEIGYYEIQYGQNLESLTETQRINGAATSYQFNNLSPGTWYFSIKVVDTNGLESSASEIVSKEISE